MINLQHSSFGYDTTLVEANFCLSRGFVYFLVGKNGIGKTTFLQTLAGNIQLFSGELLIDGKNIKHMTLNEKSLGIAFIETRFPLVNFMSAFEFVSLGRFPHTDRLGRMTNMDIEKINSSFSLLKIEQLKNKRTTEISDGERQLLLIAKALVQETDLILLDEPMAFLDYSNKRILIDVLVQISIEFNKCIILSSHDIEVCSEFNMPFLVALNGKIELFQKINKNDLMKKLG
ncbi:MAG: ABC transporter ATP-binding protein [Bacteroidota bacterium]